MRIEETHNDDRVEQSLDQLGDSLLPQSTLNSNGETNFVSRVMDRIK